MFSLLILGYQGFFRLNKGIKVGRHEGSRCRNTPQRKKGVQYTMRRHALGSCSEDKITTCEHTWKCVTCNGNILSLLHVPATCRPSVHRTPLCRRNMSLQHGPSCLPTFRDFLKDLRHGRQRERNTTTSLACTYSCDTLQNNGVKSQIWGFYDNESIQMCTFKRLVPILFRILRPHWTTWTRWANREKLTIPQSYNQIFRDVFAVADF